MTLNVEKMSPETTAVPLTYHSTGNAGYEMIDSAELAARWQLPQRTIFVTQFRNRYSDGV
jgi:hypothetical protein